MSLTKEQISEIESLYLQGVRLKEIFARFPVKRYLIINLIYGSKNLERRNKVGPNAGRPGKYANQSNIDCPVPDTVKDRILVLANFGYNPREITEDIGIPYTQVEQTLRYLRVNKKICKRV